MNNRKLIDLNLLENQIKYKKTGNFFSAGVDGNSYNLQGKIQEALDESVLRPKSHIKKLIVATNILGHLYVLQNDFGVNPTTTITGTGEELIITVPGYTFTDNNLFCNYSQHTSDPNLSGAPGNDIIFSVSSGKIYLQAFPSITVDSSTTVLLEFYYLESGVLQTIVPVII